MPFISINDVNVHYQENRDDQNKGSIVFIHGSGGSIESWRFQIIDLPPGYTGIAVDLPGHGSSEGQLFKSVDEAATFMKDLLAKLNLPRPLYLAGHSMGTAISLQCARYFADYVDGLILIGGGAKLRVDPAVLEALAQGRTNPEFTRRAFAVGAPEELISRQIQAAQRNPASVPYADLSLCDKFDLRSELPNILYPALVIVGTEDLLTPVKYSEYLAQNLPNVVLHIFENAGHYVMLEKPELVNQAIKDFVV